MSTGTWHSSLIGTDERARKDEGMSNQMKCQHMTATRETSLRRWADNGSRFNQCKRNATTRIYGTIQTISMSGRPQTVTLQEFRCTQHRQSDFTFAGALPGWVEGMDKVKV